jgi:hypothetical protein
MEARFYPVSSPFLIRDRAGQKGELHFVCDDGSTAQAQGVDEETKSVLRKKLKELKRPTIAASIDALCRRYQIAAPAPEVTRLETG